MAPVDTFASTPIGSLTRVESMGRSRYIEAVLSLPRPLFNLLADQQTGAFCRGLVKAYGLPDGQAVPVAFAILRVAIGELTFDRLPDELSSVLQLPKERAHKMAREVEHDLLAPFKDQLGKQRDPARDETDQQSQDAGELSNVLDLKKQAPPPPPPPMPESRNS